MDIAIAHNFGDGVAGAGAPMTAAGSNIDWPQSDYAWTHSASVEGFFVVLTIVIVPVAILRLRRRLGRPSFAAGDGRRRGITT